LPSAVVTGASRKAGIGAAVARALAGAGCDVLITYFGAFDAAQPWGSCADDVGELLAELRAKGVRAVGLELDLSHSNAVETLFSHVQKTLGDVQILINNAAYSTQEDLEGLSAESLDRHYAVNVRANALLCQAFIKQFRGPWGRIVNLTSGQGLGPMPDELAYAASKGAVEALTTSLSPTLAARNITVNAVDPGPTDTGWMTPELRAELAAASPQGRVGLPEDAARLIAFLASEEAGWVTGQIIRSRGGF
jgi:3-oxoacyl-[acyl-carrier protein] reductase